MANDKPAPPHERMSEEVRGTSQQGVSSASSVNPSPATAGRPVPERICNHRDTASCKRPALPEFVVCFDHVTKDALVLMIQSKDAEIARLKSECAEEVETLADALDLLREQVKDEFDRADRLAAALQGFLSHPDRQSLGASHPHLAGYIYIPQEVWDKARAALAEEGKS